MKEIFNNTSHILPFYNNPFFLMIIFEVPTRYIQEVFFIVHIA